MVARKLFSALAVLAIAGCAGAYAIGVKLRDTARVEYSRMIAEETTVFCAKFVNGASSALLKQCADDLMELRHRHEVRLGDPFYSSAN